jgi:PAS domain S-box-containing protein
MGTGLDDASRDSPGPIDAALSVDAEQVLHAVADASDDAIVALDESSRILSWNRSAERIFGYPTEDVIGRPSTMLFPEHLSDRMREVLDAVIAGDRVDHVEAEIGRRDDMPVPVVLTACPVLTRGAAQPAAVVMVRDVTEQRLAQASLAEVERRLSEAERLSHTGTWMWDRRTGAVQWSDEHHRIHGCDPIEFDGTIEAHLACVHEDDRARVQRAMDDAVESGHPLDLEYRAVLPDGTQRWVHTRAEPTMGSAGTVVGLRGVGRDISGQRVGVGD